MTQIAHYYFDIQQDNYYRRIHHSFEHFDKYIEINSDKYRIASFFHTLSGKSYKA